MYKAFLIKYGEIGVKGKNRYLFEDALVRQIRFALEKVEGEFVVSKENGRIYATAQTEFDYDEVVVCERADVVASVRNGEYLFKKAPVAFEALSEFMA